MSIIKNISIPPTAGKRATVVVTEVKSNPALRDCIHRPPAVPQLPHCGILDSTTI